MIRKLSVGQLVPGMFVTDLHKPWIDHGFWRRRFLIRDWETIRRMSAAGIEEVSIDTERGLDAGAETINGRINDVERKLRARQAPAKESPQVSLGEERRRAAQLLQETKSVTLDLLDAARMGKTVEHGRLEPIVTRMIASIQRNPDALVPLARLKQADRYAGDHAVSTAALISAMGLHMGIPEPEVERLALGTLVKDVGVLALDAGVIDKPGALSQDELSVVRRHVEESLAVLDAPKRLGETAVAVILEHHERFDGEGYPYGLGGAEISLAGRMAAIADTYDAMTSERPYRRALSPAVALRQLFEESGHQFDPDLVASFIHTVGIYPVGTLVRLESGHLAVVVARNPDQAMEPVVRVIYHAERRQYVTPVEVDLSRRFGNHYGRILRAEDFQHWGLSPERWQPA